MLKCHFNRKYYNIYTNNKFGLRLERNNVNIST